MTIENIRRRLAYLAELSESPGKAELTAFQPPISVVDCSVEGQGLTDEDGTVRCDSDFEGGGCDGDEIEKDRVNCRLLGTELIGQ